MDLSDTIVLAARWASSLVEISLQLVLGAVEQEESDSMRESKAGFIDFRQEVTNEIIRLLEEGTAPWLKPWDAENSLAMPRNPTTGKAYRGGNVLHLMTVAMDRGYVDPRWMTYNQAQTQGWQVRRGEKSCRVEYWAVKEEGESIQPSRPSTAKKTSDQPQTQVIHRTYNVFNASQIDGVSSYEIKQHTQFEAVEAGETIVADAGATVTHDKIDEAYYDRNSDGIHLPRREFFSNASGYYGTTLHELAHWTGHPSRLNRDTLNKSQQFGDMYYAREELRAELASFILAAEHGIPHDPSNSASYIDSWIQCLKADKDEIFRATTDAFKITDYLSKRDPSEENTEASDVPQM